MTLPKQARRLADDARRIQEEIAQQRAEELEPVVVAPPVEETPAPPAETPPTPQSAHEPEQWEERYLTLKAKYDNEVPRLAAQNRGLSESLGQLQEEVQSLRQQMNQPPAPVAQMGEVYTPEETDRFGADLIDLIKRVVRAEVSAAKVEVTQLLDGVRGEVGNVVKTQTLTREQEFCRYLDSNVSNWRQLNGDERFIQWLATPAPFSRRTKQELLNEAVENLDGASAAAFFITYIEETAPPRPTPPDASAKDELAEQVQPRRRAGGGQPPSPPQGQPMTRSEISQFYNECARGLWNNRPQEKAKREAEIFSAQREGRIVEG